MFSCAGTAPFFHLACNGVVPGVQALQVMPCIPPTQSLLVLGRAQALPLSPLLLCFGLMVYGCRNTRQETRRGIAIEKGGGGRCQSARGGAGENRQVMT